MLEGASSHIWRQAENRMHAMRGLLAFLLGEAAAASRMTTKAQRQHAIAQLLAAHQVTSQPQLVELLAADGHRAPRRRRCRATSTTSAR